MDPNTINPASQPPVQPAGPESSGQPVAPVQPVAMSAGATPVNNQPPAAPKKHTGLVIGIIAAVGVLLLLLVGAGLFVLILFSPAAQAKKASTQFMKAASAGDSAALYTITNAQTDSEKAFLDSAAKNSQGTFKLKEAMVQGSKGYFLYILSNEKGKMGRTTVEKKEGKWIVTGYVFGSSNLALVPGDKLATEPTTAPATTSTLSCLAQDDYKWMFYDKKPSSVTYDTTYVAGKTFNKTAEMFFEPDSIKENSLASIYDDWADFASHNKDKQWKFRLEGSTYGSDAAAVASKKLANDRAEEVKRELVSRGVATDRIIIDTPHDYGKEAQVDSMNKIYRRVQVTVDPTCTSATSSSTAR